MLTPLELSLSEFTIYFLANPKQALSALTFQGLESAGLGLLTAFMNIVPSEL